MRPGSWIRKFLRFSVGVVVVVVVVVVVAVAVVAAAAVVDSGGVSHG